MDQTASRDNIAGNKHDFGWVVDPLIGVNRLGPITIKYDKTDAELWLFGKSRHAEVTGKNQDRGNDGYTGYKI